jgi:hypothetical protein
MRAIATAACALLCAGCVNTPAAPDSPVAPSGDFQSMMVSSDPPGARCTVWREGVQIATVDPTPGSVTVSRKEVPLTLRCQCPGHLDASGDVGWVAWRESSSPASPWLLGGSVALGSVGAAGTSAVLTGMTGASVGVVGTAAAMALPIVGIGLLAVLPALYIASEVAYPNVSYPAHVSLTLTPSEFPSEEARDAYFEPLVRKAESDARSRTHAVCKLVGETHAQCIREREDEPRRIEEARIVVRDGFRAKTRIASP